MTHRTFAQPTAIRSDTGPKDQQLNRLLSDLKQVSSIPVMAEHILSHIVEVTHAPHGSLYLVEHDPTEFRHLHSQGRALRQAAPLTVSLNQALIHALTQNDRILHGLAFATHQSMHTADNLLSPELSDSLIVPLVSMTTGKLIAFVLLQSAERITDVDPETVATLSTMAHIAATALDTLLLREEGHHTTALLQRADRLRSVERLAGNFTHAIRNPLTSIKTFLQLAPERAHDITFFQDFSQLALDDMNRIERLLQEMIDYAKPVKAHLTHEDLNEVLSSCLYFITLSTGGRRIKIEKELAPEPPRGMVDRQLLKQALFNLLFKAMDALGKDGGTLRVRTTSSTTSDGTQHATIEIEDKREGVSTMSPAQAVRPVYPMSLLIDKTDEMGVAIAHQIIHAHRGEIQVQHTEGSGTVFHISLPLLAA